jgi:hypothetical protein
MGIKVIDEEQFLALFSSQEKPAEVKQGELF